MRFSYLRSPTSVGHTLNYLSIFSLPGLRTNNLLVRKIPTNRFGFGCSISLLHHHYYHFSLHHTLAMNNLMANSNDNNCDEFDDDNFLMGVDLDAMEAAAYAQVGSTSTTTSHDGPDSNKRRKLLSSVGSSNNNDQPKENPNLASELTQTLRNFFGYESFKKGQLETIEAVVQNQQDVAVFMATGSGKSLCYQIPAWHTEKITIVVRPLISLMQDQVHKLNGLIGSCTEESNWNLATFLGSGQSDPTQEQAALMEGKYLIVYMTPEKLLSSGCLDKLNALHMTRRPIGLIAVDESHCVSEWGHDFRPDFRKIGQVLRSAQSPPFLRQVPIMALTATAVPRVQQDICQSLRLNNPLMVRCSFDRTNLLISVLKKDRSMSLAAAMEPLAQTLSTTTQPTQESTIIYVPSRNQVDETVSFLKQRLQKSKNQIHVEGYHAGMSTADRHIAHTNFLTGSTQVICATVAFGMGIDKPDTRRVIHFGPPKTVEEYYQQIGRAGRDNRTAECTMYVNEADFDKYKSDFYLGRLSKMNNEAVLASIIALKSYSLDSRSCRRKTLLDFFQEKPAFGDRCGTCDNCKKVATLDKNDLERDFGPLGARVVLQAVDALNEQGVGTIINVMAGKSVDSYRYRQGISETSLKDKIQKQKNAVDKKMTQDAFRELITPLSQRNYLLESSKTSNANNYSRTWTVYKLTPKGRSALLDESVPINLPVPESVLKSEEKEKARCKRVLEDLQASGLNISAIPQDEIVAGDGEVIRALSKWNSYLEGMRKRGKEDRVLQLEELLASLEKWRAQTAIQLRMAPGSVLAEQTLFSLAYTAATMPKGLKMEQSSLVAAGVRSRGLAALCKVVNDWLDKYRQGNRTEDDAVLSDDRMVLEPGKPFKPGAPWEFAVYKPQKKTGLASWESSYNRFAEGESTQAISLSPINGRPIQVGTVCGHICQALLHGKQVDLFRLAESFPPPTSSEWEQLQAAELSTGMDVCGNPLTSGPGGDKFTKTECLRPIMGDSYVDTPSDERDTEAKVRFGVWCNRLEWYMMLRRIGYQPTFTGQA